MPSDEFIAKRRKVKKRWAIGLGCIVVYLLGPSLIHRVYRAITPDSLMQSKRAEYTRLANNELHLQGDELVANAKARYKIYLWIHARGDCIDEGDGDPTPIWSDLIDYWRGK